MDQHFYSRGFQITSFHVDGGAALNSFLDSSVPFLRTPDLSEFDHIEVLRGADALFGGTGNPGATVSMVRKRPLERYELTSVASVGSWNNYRAEGDVTGPLGLDGALRGRLDGLYQDRNYFYDTARFERKRLFGALEYELTSATLLTAGGSYQWDDALPFESGLPRYPDGSDPRLPRHTALTFDCAHYDTRMREVYFQLQQEFNTAWKLKINTTAWRGSVEYAY
jgi:outer membrane receptor for ferric coprogen and ferric-rhodotorulic acid